MLAWYLAQLRGERVDFDEWLACLDRGPAGVDLRRNAAEDLGERDWTTPTPITPLEQLEAELAAAGSSISRDFREAGKGAKWDRAKVYPWRQYGWPPDKSRALSRGTRLDYSSITTIVVHTTGTDGMHPDRGLGLPAHVMLADDGTVVLCHQLLAYLWAAHHANAYSVSLEVAGNRTITPAQVVTGRAVMRYLVADLRRGTPDDPERTIEVIPHRSSSKTRPVDPDHEIWDALGAWSIDTLDGVELGPVVGDGRPLPFPS